MVGVKVAIGAVIARIVTQYSAKGSKAAQKDIAKLGKDFDKFAKRSALAFAAAGAAVGAFTVKVGTDAVRAAMEDQKSQVLLANSLRNTVGATDAAIAGTEEYITVLQKQVSVTDDELRPALSRLVGATGSIETGQKLLATALNVSAQSGADLASSSDAIIKATRGQYKGLALLVPQLSNSTIKSKDFAKALGEVDKATAGAASKRAATLEYRLKGLNIAYGEILETLGYALLPVIEKFADVVTTKVLPQLEAWIAANKDKLAASLDTILTKLPALIIQVFDLFNFIQRNLKTIEILGALLVSTFAAAKVYAGVIALSGAINVLTAAFGRQAAAATAAGTATAFATGGASALAAAAALTVFATASLVTYKQLTKNNKELTKTEKTTTAIAKDYGKVVGTTGKVLGNTTKLTAEQQKQLASQVALNKLKAMGVVPTSETNPIQLEAVRLNLLKEQNLAQQRMYDQLLANYNATERMNIASQRYADILMVIADSKISEEEVNLLAAKWNLTNIEVLKYIASVTGNVNLGKGWDAAGYAAADGWKKALEELNKYLAAVGKGAFVAPPFVPGGGGAGMPSTTSDVVDKIVQDFTKAVETIPNPQTSLPGYGAYRAGERNTSSPMTSNSGLPGYQDYRAGERASSPNVNITVNGSVTSSNDLTETVRNGILAGQTSGRSITARVLDL
jgi:hypothetical protein